MNQNQISRWTFVWIVGLALLAGVNYSAAQGTTSFTYQGQLRDGGTNANGTYTMTFKLYDALTSGGQIASTVTSNLALANGLFSVSLDFGASAFNGSPRWLDITAQTGTNVPETLTPRVQMLPAPYALYTAVAATTTSLVGGTWNVSVGNYQTYTNILRFAPNGSTVMAVHGNGILVNGEIEANEVRFNSGGSISSDGQGGIQLDGSINASNLVLHGSSLQFPAQSGATMTVDNTGDFIFDNNVRITALGKISLPSPGGTRTISGDIAGLTVNSAIFATAFNTTSDRNVKEQFTSINSREILDRVIGLPISSWSFKADGSTRHIGPMAQDFYAAFNVGPDDKHIATVDADGVALAAIQGLNEKLKEKDAKIEAMEKRLEDLEESIKSSTHK